LKKTLVTTISICLLATLTVFFLIGCAQQKPEPSETQFVTEDDQPYFDGLDGCAVFLDGASGIYHVYNVASAQKQTAPNSSFKIISCLIGLESGVIDPANSEQIWDGTVYPISEWNRNLTYDTAFRVSAIWYYRNVLDQIGEDTVQETLDQLQYGNCDIHQWKGSMCNLVFPTIKDLPSINGFWQESSLKISPIEQTSVMATIFGEKSAFGADNIALLKNVMVVDSGNPAIQVYGKTGSGIFNDSWSDAWFVGFFTKDNANTYFAVRINTPGASGKDAKKITLEIIDNRFGT
jgi:beta-lactamase class D